MTGQLTLRVPNRQPPSLDEIWEVRLQITFLTLGKGIPEFHFQPSLIFRSLDQLDQDVVEFCPEGVTN